MSPTAEKPNGLALPEPVSRRGINEAQWRTLKGSLYPGASSESVLMVLDYCAARHLDPMKKPCHIVPMRVKNAATGNYEWRDVVMPGIYELRTTAQRTGEYLGHAKPEYGPLVEVAGVTAPEYCDFTAYRWNATAKLRAEFPVRTFFKEVVGTKDGHANDRWSKAPVQMLVKCAEAAGLREAFPDELGGEQTAEEMDGQSAITITPLAPTLPEPDGYDDWILTLTACADEGDAKLSAAWKAAKKEYREYLTATEPEAWDLLKDRAAAVDATKDLES